MKSGLVLLAGALLFTAYAHAAGTVYVTNFSVWSNTYNDPTIRVTTGETRFNPESCTDPDSYMVDDTLPDLVKNRIFSTLMAAKMAGKKIRLWISGCYANRPAIKTVILE